MILKTAGYQPQQFKLLWIVGSRPSLVSENHANDVVIPKGKEADILSVADSSGISELEDFIDSSKKIALRRKPQNLKSSRRFYSLAVWY